MPVVSSSDDLNTDSLRVFNMKPRVEVLFRICPARFEFPRHSFLVELLDADREVIHYTSGTLVVERNQSLPYSEAHDLVGLVFTHHRQSEHLLVKGNRTRQIAHLNAHVV